MSKENTPDAKALAPKVVRKRCPLDASILVHKMVDGLMGWECPECGYFEPDPL